MAKFSRGNVRSSRLTPAQVYEIRLRYAKGETQGALGREFGVSVGTVGRIVRGESWQAYDNPAEAAVGPVMPTGAEISAAEARLTQQLSGDQHKDTESPPDPLSEFVSPEARAKYLGEGK